MGFSLKKTIKKASNTAKKGIKLAQKLTPAAALGGGGSGGGSSGSALAGLALMKGAGGLPAGTQEKMSSMNFDPSTGDYLSSIEKKVGIQAPKFESLRDAQGNLQSQYKVDPYAGEATQKLRAEAFGNETSPWARMKLEQQGLEETQGRDQIAKQQAQAQAQAMQGLMRQGGLSGGSRAFLASQGAKNQLLAGQQLAGQGMGARLGIQSEDLGRKQGLLQDFAGGEQKAQVANLGTLTGDIAAKRGAEMERYQANMGAYGAEKSAIAQENAAKAAKPKQGLLGGLLGGIF